MKPDKTPDKSTWQPCPKGTVCGMVFRNKRNKLLLTGFVSLLVATCITSFAINSWQSVNASYIETENMSWSPESKENKKCSGCEKAMCLQDRYQAGQLDDCTREKIERHLANCPRCARIYQCGSH